VRIEKLKAEHDVKVEWVHFPLHPDTPAEGRALADLFAGRNLDLKAAHAQMKARWTPKGCRTASGPGRTTVVWPRS